MNSECTQTQLLMPRKYLQDSYSNAIDVDSYSCQVHVNGSEGSSQACGPDLNATVLLGAAACPAAGNFSVSVALGLLGSNSLAIPAGTLEVAAATPYASYTRVPALEGGNATLTAGTVPPPIPLLAMDSAGGAASEDCTGYTVRHWTWQSFHLTSRPWRGSVYFLLSLPKESLPLKN